jgi:hypothetical protein
MQTPGTILDLHDIIVNIVIRHEVQIATFAALLLHHTSPAFPDRPLRHATLFSSSFFQLLSCVRVQMKLPLQPFRPIPRLLRPKQAASKHVPWCLTGSQGFQSLTHRGYATTYVSAADLQFGQPVHETHPHVLKSGESTWLHSRACRTYSLHA